MTVVEQVTTRSATIIEVFQFLWQRKLWWLVPLVILLFIMGILFLLAQASSVAPWMYPL